MDSRVEHWRRVGLDISCHRRTNRKGYKAGAMLAFDAEVKGEYIAIFDTDFVPDARFLTDCVPYLVDNPGLAFVQGRWTYLNQDVSTFTRSPLVTTPTLTNAPLRGNVVPCVVRTARCRCGAERRPSSYGRYVEISLNFHIEAEQYVRSSASQYLQFNGTGGVWRKAAMDVVGGWVDETVVEDLDLSLRVHLAGWSALWLHQVRTPNELPSELAAYRTQQHRWSCGPTQVLNRCAKIIRCSRLPLVRKLQLVIFFFGARSISVRSHVPVQNT